MSVILDVQALSVAVAGGKGAARIVDDVTFEVRAGETLAVMGESGAGKSMMALALLGLLPRAIRVTGGSAVWNGRDLLRLSPEAMRRIRGAEIGIVFQDPMTSMHPTMPVDAQVAEALQAHRPNLTRAEALLQVEERMEQLGVPRGRVARSSYPFEWSGGMRQRALIAMAMANRPALLIADEPTTALDATTKAQVLEILRGLQKETGTAILLITHDASVVAEMADRVVVQRQGRVVETGTVDEVLRRPRHPYTASIVTAQAGLAAGAPGRSSTPDVLCVERLRVDYQVGSLSNTDLRTVRAVDDVSLSLAAGQSLAIVGESGCGKSTLARSLVGLETPSAGRILVDGIDLVRASTSALHSARRRIQIVFQNPYASLNPRRDIAGTIAQPLHIHGEFARKGGVRRVGELLEQVGLPPDYGRRYPHELSGGERQRVAIARALAVGPAILILDEPTSALDVPARTGILTLLLALQKQRGLAFILMAHDLEMVRGVAHFLAVMHLGRIVETGPTAELFENPRNAYTQTLFQRCT